jgi:hypothetical protein
MVTNSRVPWKPCGIPHELIDYLMAIIQEESHSLIRSTYRDVLGYGEGL